MVFAKIIPIYCLNTLSPREWSVIFCCEYIADLFAICIDREKDGLTGWEWIFWVISKILFCKIIKFYHWLSVKITRLLLDNGITSNTVCFTLHSIYLRELFWNRCHTAGGWAFTGALLTPLPKGRGWAFFTHYAPPLKNRCVEFCISLVFESRAGKLTAGPSTSQRLFTRQEIRKFFWGLRGE